MILRDSKRGPFLGCSAFPKCRSTKMVKKLTGDDLKQVEALIPLLKEEAHKSQEMIAKVLGENPTAGPTSVGPKGPVTTDIDCDECGKPMVIRTGRRGKFLGCSGYPKCKNTAEVPAKLLEEMGLNGNGNGNGQAAKVEPPPMPLEQEHEDAA
jgi:DNA topoisomerase-1